MLGISTAWFEQHVPHLPGHRNTDRTSQAANQPQAISLVYRLGQAVTNFLRCSTEPQVWQKRDRHGNLCWQLYDPSTNQSATFASADEVRMWLEERYSR